MNEPSTRFLLELAKALRKATHQNVAEHMAAGLMWATWPEWFDKSYWPHVRGLPEEEGEMTALEIYDELREAHAIIKRIYTRGLIGDALLDSALDAVDGVLYLAEGEAVRAQQRRDEGKKQ